ncbi:DUF4242 domain-containing protein [Nitriliruptor alkaliphilus]|uniref:DUF4242 domain-containing protein n=1 Tax=Nitriliruptor alkaliphilus TaxID=427918 RepID=UPI0006978D83|nr:DUF4242 domain-containing protein [Nitriliruptor alkaliphilus]
MPRYLITRHFPEGLTVPLDDVGADACAAIATRNALHDVTWLHSYVTPDRSTTFCVYDGPDPEALRRAAGDNELPVELITEVRVLDPYFYLPAEAHTAVSS